MKIRRGRMREDMVHNSLYTGAVPIMGKEIKHRKIWSETPIGSRVVIDGVPGAGKTTFIKRLCYLWAHSVKGNILEEQENFAESVDDKIFIPVILRFVKHEKNIFEILFSQLSFLSISEMCAIEHLIKASPTSVILLLDGFDELSRYNFIQKLIGKEQHSEVLCLTTSRPHAIEQLKHLTSHAIDHHIKLCGFSDPQVFEYIKLFFKHRFRSEERAAPLIDKLRGERKELLQIAHVPIRCEIICIVWAHYGKLGDTVAQLYTLFIIQLLDHMQHKYTPDSRESDQQLIRRYHPILMRIGKLANSWVNKGRLCIVFTTQQVKHCLGEYFSGAVKIGLVTKSHPSSQLEQSQWSFPHLTIQEFMVAYHIANADDSEIQEFIQNSKSYKMLKRNEVVFQFLCSKDSQAANKLISRMIVSWKDEESCLELLKFVCCLLPYYKPSTMHLPLPRCLDLTKMKYDDSDNEKKMQENEKLLKCVKTLLDMDRTANLQNLRQIKAEDLTILPNILGQSYVTECSIYINEDDQSEGLKNMTSLVSLDVTLPAQYDDYRIQRVLHDTPNTSLENLNISGYNITSDIAVDITRFTNLKKLTITEKGSNVSEEQVAVLLNNIKKCPITSLHCTFPDIYKPIMSFTGKTSLSLKIREVTSESLYEGASQLREQIHTVNIHKLDLSSSTNEYRNFCNNDLCDEGRLLGELVVRIPFLEVLILRRCYIYKQTLDEMIKEIGKASCEPNLKQLDLSDNPLHRGGSIGFLLYHLPHIHTLMLSDCYLTKSTLAAIADALPASTNIQTLNLTIADFYENDNKKITSWYSYTSHGSYFSEETQDETQDHTAEIAHGNYKGLVHTDDTEITQEQSDKSDSYVWTANDEASNPRMDSEHVPVAEIADSELHSQLCQSEDSGNSNYPELKNTVRNNTNNTELNEVHEPKLYESSQTSASTSQYRLLADTQLQSNHDKKIIQHEHKLQPAPDAAICGCVRLLQHMPRLKALKLADQDFAKNADPMSAVCGAVDTGALKQLCILDMSFCHLQNGSLQLLGQHLPSFSELQALSLFCVMGVSDCEDYCHVYKNVPESLQYLDVWSDDIWSDPYLLLEYKHQMRHIHRLNVRFDNKELDMVQELLEEHNPDIHVYSNDNGLEIWKVYVTEEDIECCLTTSD